ncbi:Histidine kinase-, DNA gyrase B-, and HSP90-like ATPase [Clostridium cavendishii DSM 21758]|uniref:histidine kinase n=1 Tax=Clostridium cavendishii DSM 21758 TaxID=1121302 RepID=A0A1M6CAR7_9CLOT|nr:HAMP domain-containing sensor histidine kinase [Clostridium cavendishii]SHI58130.1 Histidine kinase-, DNA gyrase B-, and HSP90-like ATPase [Clostridium cavendishii DSM 21758]
MLIAVVILTIIVIILSIYVTFIQLQLHNINKQLHKRLSENTRQPLSLELFNKEFDDLAININKCLKAEETLRLNSIREEKRFKELIANISHDLRTPLTAIKGYQQLMEKGELTDSQREKLHITQKHSEELGRMIEHFFEYSYLINVEPVVNLERINLTNLVTECLADLVTTLEENNLTVSLKASSSIFILADKEMVTRIVQNLIRNCVQHSTGNIEVSLLTFDKRAIISVRNSVNPNCELEADKLFDRFYTGDKSRNNSTGLGLSIVRLLAEQMDGSVGAEMKAGLLDLQVKLPLYKN